MEQSKLDQYKSDLEAKKSELVGRIDALNADKNREHKGAVSADSEDRAQEIENDEVVDGLEDIESKELVQVEGALKRIAEGQYGNCAECGEAIPEARLKAVPYALNCMACAN